MKKLQCFTVICVKILKDPSEFFVYIVTSDHCLNSRVVHLLGPRVKLEINAFKKRSHFEESYQLLWKRFPRCHGNASRTSKSMRYKTHMMPPTFKTFEK